MSSTSGKRKNTGDGNVKRKQRKSKQNDDDSDSEFDNASVGSNDEQKNDSGDTKDDLDDLLAEDSGLVSSNSLFRQFLLSRSCTFQVLRM